MRPGPAPPRAIRGQGGTGPSPRAVTPAQSSKRLDSALFLRCHPPVRKQRRFTTASSTNSAFFKVSTKCQPRRPSSKIGHFGHLGNNPEWIDGLSKKGYGRGEVSALFSCQNADLDHAGGVRCGYPHLLSKVHTALTPKRANGLHKIGAPGAYLCLNGFDK